MVLEHSSVSNNQASAPALPQPELLLPVTIVIAQNVDTVSLTVAVAISPNAEVSTTHDARE